MNSSREGWDQVNKQGSHGIDTAVSPNRLGHRGVGNGRAMPQCAQASPISSSAAAPAAPPASP